LTHEAVVGEVGRGDDLGAVVNKWDSYPQSERGHREKIFDRLAGRLGAGQICEHRHGSCALMDRGKVLLLEIRLSGLSI
jgi:hypothetical protein